MRIATSPYRQYVFENKHFNKLEKLISISYEKGFTDLVFYHLPECQDKKIKVNDDFDYSRIYVSPYKMINNDLYIFQDVGTILELEYDKGIVLLGGTPLADPPRKGFPVFDCPGFYGEIADPPPLFAREESHFNNDVISNSNESRSRRMSGMNKTKRHDYMLVHFSINAIKHVLDFAVLATQKFFLSESVILYPNIHPTSDYLPDDFFVSLNADHEGMLPANPQNMRRTLIETGHPCPPHWDTRSYIFAKFLDSLVTKKMVP